ncbi:hypothetical protein CTA2_1586 [Colletotrichum tanaceti]|uniref:Uncharacterized protein n=1 Tax=Colletotrichum tanaceti TaxID=1306861 RepID=A0A4U6XTH0_9PEZI|nr:hypothetical protein CTA2_1586 [Colletotrichum tanaceti]TKW59224.1 hypothetical protein CTA1_2012 [Colletotrichum tanaceti]
MYLVDTRHKWESVAMTMMLVISAKSMFRIWHRDKIKCRLVRCFMHKSSVFVSATLSHLPLLVSETSIINVTSDMESGAIVMGDSVTGLSLANLLELLGIDYMLPKAYETTFLMLSPLSLQDRLAVHICRSAIPPPGSARSHLKTKDKILAGKHVTGIEATAAGVQVQTQDGCTYADGVYSTIRAQSQNKVHLRHLLAAGDVTSQRAGDSVLQGLELPGRFSPVPTANGTDIPSYTAEDEASFTSQHLDNKIIETVTFRGLYVNRHIAALVPLLEQMQSLTSLKGPLFAPANSLSRLSV